MNWNGNDSYIINLGSTAGTVLIQGPMFTGHQGFFIKQFSTNLRADLAGKKIRVSIVGQSLRRNGVLFCSLKGLKNLGRSPLSCDALHAIQPERCANTVTWLISLAPNMSMSISWNHAGFPSLWPSTRLSWLNHSTREVGCFITSGIIEEQK